MPTYKTLYKGSWVNIETDILNANNQKQIDVYIYDTESGIGSVETTINLDMAGEPTVIESVNNSEDKFEVFRPKKADIKIHSSGSIRIETFADGGDNRWYVEIYYDSAIKFKGWLSISDLSEEFMPEPNEILLVATDGYNFLESEELVDFDDTTPENDNQIIFYLSRALAKTGLQLDIWCVFNIREAGAAHINSTNITQLSSFIAASDTITTGTTSFFYIGQIVQVTGTASNNITFTVLGVTQSIVTFIASNTALADESNVNATFTDVSSGAIGHFFKHEWLNTTTFEKDVNTLQDCKTVVDAILKKEAYITQYNGVHLIVRVDELQTSDLIVFKFDYTGAFLSRSDEVITKSVGVDQLVTWMNDSQVKSMERPVKIDELVFNYNYPQEIPCNVDFSEGDFIADMADETIDGQTYNVKKYEADCWIMGRFRPDDAGLVGVSGVDAYIKKYFQNGYEKQRFVVLGFSTETNPFTYLRSKPIYLQKSDKGQFDYDFKFSVNTVGNLVSTAGMLFLGDSGQTYVLNASFPLWFILPGTSFFATKTFTYNTTEDKDVFQSMSFPIAPVPEDGKLFIFLVAGYNNSGTGNPDAYFNNLHLTIFPFVNGSYQVYAGQVFSVTQPTEPEKYKQVLSDEVFMSDAPRRAMKGAILKIVSFNPLYTGDISFSTTSTFVTQFSTGNLTGLFPIGAKITTSGTNNDYYTIEDVVYHTIGDYTEVTIKENNLTLLLETVTIYELVMGLANSFYNAAVFPDGVPDSTYLHPYGHLQILDLWNQNNRVMAKFEGEIDHLDNTTDIPDMAHRYLLTDSNLSTNGKVFMPLHMRNNLHDVESNIFLHEVFDENIPKEYPTPDFKYIT